MTTTLGENSAIGLKRRHDDFLLRRFYELRRRVEFGDLLLFFYIAVFVRSYLWGIGDNTTAWIATALIAVLIWCGYLRHKEDAGERVPPLFWLIVAAPLTIVYMLRVVFPDVSYDVLNYHLVLAERGLRGFPLLTEDFFPVFPPVNPAPDMLTGIFRHLLGYRLGTIVNLFAMFWTGEILYKMLRGIVGRLWLRCVCVSLILLTEQMLFEINNYMVDLLTLPLLLEATRIALDSDVFKVRSRTSAYFALLLGASVAFKLTNLIFVIPILLLCFYKGIVGKAWLSRAAIWRVLCLVVTFILPLLPHALWIYLETGSPVFPLYNNIFHSPYWLPFPVGDPRWGPHTALETIFWSVLIFFLPERLSELPVYTGRISLSVIVAVISIALTRDARLRAFSFMLLLGALLWSGATGYIRYGLYLEVIGGIIIVRVCRRLFGDDTHRTLTLRRTLAATLALLFCVGVIAGLNYVRFYDWSMRPTLLTNPANYFSESRNLLRDHSAAVFLTTEARDALEPVEAWVVSDAKTNGIEVALKPELPMIGLHNEGYLQTDAARGRLAQSLDAADGRRMFSLVFSENLSTALANIRRGGLQVESVRPLRLNFFSPTLTLDMQLIEVSRLSGRQEPGRPLTSLPGQSALTGNPPAFFNADLALLSFPPRLPPGGSGEVRVRVVNASGTEWHHSAGVDGTGQINLGNHWLSAGYIKVINDDGRSALPHALPSGASVELSLRITAPDKPGEYILEVDMVQERVAWFGDAGSRTAKVKVIVE